MSNLKRLLALAFAVLMIVGCLPASAKTFTDTEGLTEEENYAIGLLSDLGIILGKGDGSFGSEDSVNRKEMAIFASRLQTGEAFGESYGENVTPFADVITDFEAILYAHNMGIVVGDESGLFRPNEAVSYQDVLTMIVRSLGYKDAEMDMGYPYSYIVKAKELGITEGVELSLTESVKRKQVALLLSNALFAEKENGKSTADELFGIDTYVVTAAYGENLTGVDAHLAGGSRVVVQPLNSDGTINDMYYHIPAAEFKKAGLVATPGASFVISSMDNLETVKSITACPSIKLSNEGEEIFLTPNGKVEISRTDYKAVHRYSQVYNTQGTQSGEKEIIVYNQRGKSTIIAYDWFKTNRDKIAYLVIDSVGNIYGRDGEILVYYFAEDKNDPYKAYNEEKNDYVDVTEKYIWDNAALSDTPHYDKIASLRTDAFGNILDADGYVIAYYMPGLNGGNYDWPYFGYDKATGTYYPVDENSVWEKAEQYQDNTTHYYVWTGDEIDPATGKLKNPDSSFVLSNKNEYYTAIAYDDDFDGDYDRVFYSYSSAPMGSFTYVEGLVTAVSNNQMTIAGTQYRYSEYARPDTYNKYIGMNVKATLCDGEIYSIGGCSSTWVIFEDYTALAKSGYAVANAFSGSSELRPIVVASVDGYFFMKNNLSFFTDTETNNIDGIYDKLKTGELYTATKDYYGYYHISTDSVRGQYIDGEWANTTTVKFKNGISTSATLPSGTNYRFEADDDREFIIFNPETKSFITGKGFPSDGSTLEFAARKGVVGSTGVSLANNSCVHFLGSGLVYFSDARFNGAFATDFKKPVLSKDQTDVVYVSASAAANYSVDQNVTGLTGPGETIVGFRYVYKDSVLSLVSGDYVTVCTEGIFNYKLEVGFYYVINGVIDRKITDFEDDPDCPIALGRLEKMDIDTLRLVEVSASGTEGEVYEEALIKGRLYALNPNLDTLIQGGAWNFLSTFCRSNGLPVGPVNVFYAKPTLYTSSPVMIALPENRNDIWDKWGGSADSLTYGKKTYVVTAVGDYNITGINADLKNGSLVALQLLNNDGSIDGTVHYIPVSMFTERGITPVHGASYKIECTDNMSAITSIVATPSIKLADNGETVDLSGDGKLKINGITYTAVERLSGAKQIIVYNQRGYSLPLTENGPAVCSNGTVYPTWTGDVNGSSSPLSLTDKDDAYHAVAYDDDCDGDYDRLFFMYYSFGIGGRENCITCTPDESELLTDPANGIITPYFADSVISIGDYVSFYADSAKKPITKTWNSNTLTAPAAEVAKKYNTTNVFGLVTAVNGKKMTVGGTEYDIASLALHNFSGLVPYRNDDPARYMGKQVTAVIFEGGIFEIKETTETLVIVADLIGLTTDGRIAASAYEGSVGTKDITIASVDGSFAPNLDSQSALGRLKVGGFYYATKDAYGDYHIDTAKIANDPMGDGRGQTSKGYTKFIDNGGSQNITFNGGRSSSLNFFNPNFDGDSYAGAPNDWYHEINPITAAGAPNGKKWEFIIFDGSTGTFVTGKGFPTNGSTLKWSMESNLGAVWSDPLAWTENDVYYIIDGNIIYWPNAKFTGSFSEEDYNDVVYLSASNAASYSTVAGPNGSPRYKYDSNVFSLVTATNITVCTENTSATLGAGFYVVKNGIIDRKITNMQTDPDCPIVSSNLTRGDSSGFVVEEHAPSTSGATGAVHTGTGSYRIYGLNCAQDTLVWGDGAGGLAYWTTRGAYCSQQGWAEGTIRVFYAKDTLKTDNPVLIAISQNDSRAWDIVHSWGMQ